MQSVRHIQRTHVGLLLAGIALFALAGCHQPNASLISGSGSAGSITAPNRMSVAVAVKNDGTAIAEDVVATAVSIDGATLTDTVLPESIGAINPEGTTTIDATFAGASLKSNGSYLVKVTGTFREHGRRFPFAFAQKVTTPPESPGSTNSKASSSPPNIVNGAHFAAQKPNFGDSVNESDRGPRIPNGPHRPAPNPKPPQSNAQAAGDLPNITFNTNTPIGISSSTVNEPSGASATGGIVFETANWYAAFSTNAGATFTQLDPTTIFDNSADGGYCCDQIVQYVPSIDRFVWILQYNQAHLPTDKPGSSTGPNRYRIAAASPATVKSTGGTSWTYWDITSGQIAGTAAGTWVDYPDAVVGDNYLYLSTDQVGGGRIVVRLPLSQIQSGSTINFNYTQASDGGLAYGGHLSQNTGDEVFWAGHYNSSTIRVFNWPESSTSYSWRDVSIGSWPQTNSSNLMTSSTPDGQDWLNKLSGFPGNAVLGLARVNVQGDRRNLNQVILAWTGAKGGGFSQPQVQWIALDRNNNFSLVSQQQVWNPDYAFAYPAFAVNSNGALGMSLEFGGGGNYENHVAGFWGDYVVYITTHSDTGTSRFGDYVTIRRNTADPAHFDAFGYGLNKATPPASGVVVDTHYVVFSRP